MAYTRHLVHDFCIFSNTQDLNINQTRWGILRSSRKGVTVLMIGDSSFDAKKCSFIKRKATL